MLFKSQENTFVKVGLRCCCLKKGQIFYFAAFEFLIFEPCRQVGNLCSMFCLMFVREKLSLFRKPQNFFSLQAAFEPRWRHYNNINLVKSFQLFARSVHFESCNPRKGRPLLNLFRAQNVGEGPMRRSFEDIKGH